MANQSTVGFGLRPLRQAGQGDYNAGLGEWSKLQVLQQSTIMS